MSASDRQTSGRPEPTVRAAVGLAPDGGTARTALAGPLASRGWRYAYFVAACAAACLLVAGPLLFPPKIPLDQHVYLADNLVQGRLSVDNLPRFYPDWVPWNGHIYLPFGPLPAVVLVPFLPVLHLGLPLSPVVVLFTLLNILLFYKALSRWGLDRERVRWVLLLFFAGTVYFNAPITGSSYGFSHVLTVTCLLLAVNEALGRRRPWLLGLFVGLAAMSRLSAGFVLPFFLWLIWRDYRSFSPGDANPATAQNETATIESTGCEASPVRARLASIALVVAGLAGPLVLIALYNYLRFGSPMETGYSMSNLGHDNPMALARSYGLFSVVHIPKNLFMMLLQGPLPYPSVDAPVLRFPYLTPSPWGMSLFLTTPALIYAFRTRLGSPLAQAVWLGTLCALVPIATHYGIGLIQFGYRYALDFLPLVVLLVARGLPSPMSRVAGWLVLAGVAVDIWGALFLIFWSV